MEKLIIIKTKVELDQLLIYLKDKDFVSYDVETTGLEHDASIIGYSVCAEENTAYYVIVREWDKEKQLLVDTEALQYTNIVLKLLLTKQLIMHNSVFDCMRTANNFGVDLMPALHTDTLTLSHLLNENRSNSLKNRAKELFGNEAVAEQEDLTESIKANGGTVFKKNYELFKADSDIIARYGAKDAILTYGLFLNDIELLEGEGLLDFFYKDESMPLLRGTTYDLNRTGLKIDPDKINQLKATLEGEIIQAKFFINEEIKPYVEEKYPGTTKINTFNFNSNAQLSWLLFIKLGNEFSTLTALGKELCNYLNMPLPYTLGAKKEFLAQVVRGKGMEWTKNRTIGEPEKYLTCAVGSLQGLASKYRWVQRLMQCKKLEKMVGTYICPIIEKSQYNIIRPSFNQSGTSSGRYSSSSPNFQNLPRDDKRIKSCIVARPGKVFIGSDYSQLEPRVFASFSKDARLLACFSNGEDFYSVIGYQVFGGEPCSMKKDEENSYAKKYPLKRQIAKTIALSTTYGTTASKLSPILNMSLKEAQNVIDDYFDAFPSVKKLMDTAHDIAIETGVVKNLFGRPRRIPRAMEIKSKYKLPYEYRNFLNLAINHTIQSTAASIVNRAAIQFNNNCRYLEQFDARWKEVRLVLQIHDELVAEGPDSLKEDIIDVLKDAMENTVVLPGVRLIAEPKAAYNLADLK